MRQALGKAIFDFIVGESGGRLVLTALGALGLAILGYLQSLPWAVVLLMVPLGFGAILFAVNQAELWRERGQHISTRQSDEVVENTLREWAYRKTQFRVRDDLQENALFQFIAEDMFGLETLVTRLKSTPEEVLIWCNLSVSPRGAEDLAKLPSRLLEEIAADLRIEMARIGVEYVGFQVPLNRMVVQRHVRIDEIRNRTVFFDHLTFVRRAAVVVSEIVKRGKRLALDRPVVTEQRSIADTPSSPEPAA